MKKVKSRILQIRNFKNIGLSKKDNEYQELYLDSYLDDKIVGNLIILIGENNIGKSNVLKSMDIIIKIKNIDVNSENSKEFFRNNKPNNVQYINSPLEIKLMDEKHEYGVSFDNDNISIINNFTNDKMNEIIKTIKEDMIRLLDKNIEILVSLKKDIEIPHNFNIFDKKKNELNNINLNNINNKDFEKLFEKFKKDYDILKKNIKFFKGFCKNNCEKLEYPSKDIVKEYLNNNEEESFIYCEEKQEEFEKIQKEFEPCENNTNIYTRSPNIKKYERINLLDEDLIISNKDIDNKTKFFTPLLNKIENGRTFIKEVYHSKITLKNEINKMLDARIKETFCKKFNELANKLFGKHEYDFKFDIEVEDIKLLIERDNETINLSEQSEGFRWFFEFFFQFYFIYDLQAGDIILIDEPDAHLSIPSVKGLRNIIKKIAKEMGVTFVTTTHNPFFVDIDYFDEIRIVKKKKDGDGVEIVNFGDIDSHTEADTLKEIIDAFGLGNLNRDIITNPDNKVIFVEGITDYNYLTAFKLLYNRKNDNEKLNLSFIPIAGLGKNKEEFKNKIKILSKFKNVIILTDEDKKVYEYKDIIKELSISKEKIKVIKLTEINENFKEIEYLFSENDKEKFKYIIKKSFETSSLFKNIIFDLEEELEEETINNFNEVLKRLDKISQNLSDL